MKHLCIAVALMVAFIIAPLAISSAQAAAAATGTATAAGKAMDQSISKNKAAAASTTATKGAKKPKNCNPAKSKPCGNACIPLARTCHAK